MDSIRIPGATRAMGREQGYQILYVKDISYHDGSRALQSQWMPSPNELARLNAGQPVTLTILGTGQPPVRLDVLSERSTNGRSD